MKNKFQIFLVIASLLSFFSAVYMFYVDLIEGVVLIISGITSLFVILLVISLKRDQKIN
tara:strand:+ start:234 stop:410 length:177 start_codon:yes stop_codon:yes gene_type:complete